MAIPMILAKTPRSAAMLLEQALEDIHARKLDTVEGNRKEVTFWTVPDCGVVLVVRYLNKDRTVMGCELMLPASTSVATAPHIEALHQWVSNTHSAQAAREVK
jgi:hypothetical protein